MHEHIPDITLIYAKDKVLELFPQNPPQLPDSTVYTKKSGEAENALGRYLHCLKRTLPAPTQEHPELLITRAIDISLPRS